MSPRLLMGLLLCVCTISVGQVLFKISSGLVGAPETRMRGLMVLGVALFLYGGATLGWIAMLTRVPLTFAYVFMALSFLLVPAISTVVLGERPAPSYWLGALLIIAGVVVAANAARGA